MNIVNLEGNVYKGLVYVPPHDIVRITPEIAITPAAVG